jgi:hypothetical protein
MGKLGGKGRQWGGASTEAVIATPAFVALVLTAIELMVISWKVLSLQMVANQAARDYATWLGCDGTGSWTNCRSKPGHTDWVLSQVKSKINTNLGPRYALKMTSRNTTVTVATIGDNQAANACGNSAPVPGTEDGRGSLFELAIVLKNDIFGLGLFQFDLTAQATAVMEPYGTT